MTSRNLVLVSRARGLYAGAMPDTIPSSTFPTYVQCASCIYWVPAAECSDAGECKDCWLGTNDEFPF